MLKNIILITVIFVFSGTVTNAETVKLVTGNDYSPFTDETLPNGGMATEIVTAVFADMGHELAFDWLPWKRGYRLAQQGTYLGTFPYIFTDEREKDFLYSLPIAKISERLISFKGNDKKINQWSDVEGITVCLPLGYATAKTMTEKFASGSAERITKETMSNCFEPVKSGRNYYVLAGGVQAWFTARKLGIDFNELSVSELDVSENRDSGLSLIISRNIQGGAGWIERFNISLTKLQDNGMIDRIFRKHLGEDFPVELLN